MFSTEQRGAERRNWSLFGAQLDQILDQVFQPSPGSHYLIVEESARLV
jgi:hypothetical protein